MTLYTHQYPLDIVGVGAVGAWSIRRLTENISLVDAARISNSDDVYDTVGFVDDILDESAISAHCTGELLDGTGRLRNLYNQVNIGSNSAFSATRANQPIIYTNALLDGYECDNTLSLLDSWSTSHHEGINFNADSEFSFLTMFKCVSAVTPETNTSSCAVLMKGATSGTDYDCFGFSLLVDTDGKIFLAGGARVSDGTNRYNTIQLTDSVYRTAILTYKDRTFRTYLSGVEFGSPNELGLLEDFTNLSSLYMNPGTVGIIGFKALAHIVYRHNIIYNRALTYDEIKDLSTITVKNVQAAAVSNSQIDLSWDTVWGANGYHVRYRKKQEEVYSIHDDFTGILREDRPRLYLSSSDIDNLRTFAETDSDYTLSKNYVTNEKNKSTKVWRSWSIAWSSCFVALIENDPEDPDGYVAWAKSYVLDMASVTAANANEAYRRDAWYSFAYGYDFLYEYLSVQEKTAIRDAAWSYATHYSSVEFHLFGPGSDNIGNCFQGHNNSYANSPLMMCCLTFRGDDDRFNVTNFQSRNRSMLSQIHHNISNCYANIYDLFGGSHKMGWHYSGNYDRPEAIAAWYYGTVTKEKIEESYFDTRVLFFIYGNNNNMFPQSYGDVFSGSARGNQYINMLMSFLSSTGEGLAEYYWQNQLAGILSYHRWHRCLFKSITEGTTTPVNINTLPLSRYFKGGIMLSRTGWSDTTPYSAMMSFKSWAFDDFAHHSRDQNSVCIDYKGPLLSRSGTYDSSFRAHHTNFYIRSCAKNTLIVDGHVGHSDWTNSLQGFYEDGGQKLEKISGYGYWINITAASPGGSHARTGITKHGTSASENACYSQGDASLSYNSPVTSFVRDVLFVHEISGYSMPIMMVYDSVVLDSADTARILWQTINAPDVTVANKAFWENNANGVYYPGGGHIRLEFLQANAQRSVVEYSGSGLNQEFVGAYDPVNETNIWKPETVGNAGTVEVGWGRIEITNNTADLDQDFVTVAVVGDEKVTDLVCDYSSLVAITGVVATRIKNTLLVINKTSPASIDVSGEAGIVELFLAGWNNAASVIIDFGGGNTTTVTFGENEVIHHQIT